MAKENSIKIKREPTMWGNIFANDTSDKGLISKIYKELTQLHSRKTNNPIKRSILILKSNYKTKVVLNSEILGIWRFFRSTERNYKQDKLG